MNQKLTIHWRGGKRDSLNEAYDDIKVIRLNWKNQTAK